MKSPVEKAFESLILTRNIADENKSALEDTVILHINHALPDVFALNEILVKKLGAKVFFITTPYNRKEYPVRGYDYLYIHRKNRSSNFYFNKKKLTSLKSSKDFIENIHIATMYGLRHINKKYSEKKLIVLQDGGYTAVKSLHFDVSSLTENKNFLGMVEQTQGGSRMFHEYDVRNKLEYPVLTISRSQIKMRLECHFIAQRIIEELNKSVYRFGQFINFRNVIVGGYGVIGRQVAKYARGANAHVIVYDNNPKALAIAEKEGFKTINRITSKDIEKSFCYIGCTGHSSFSLDSLAEFIDSKSRKFFLASGSSKRYEFNDLIQLFENENCKSKNPSLKNLSDFRMKRDLGGFIEYSFSYQGVKKTLILLGEGFPINFYFPESESVPDRAIDPIQALLLSCIIKLRQNHKDLKKGLLHIAKPTIKRKLKIDEEDLLYKWFYLNDISPKNLKPFSLFKPHPLEKELIETY